MLLRIRYLCWLSTLISAGHGRTLLEVLQTTPSLSILYNSINASTSNITDLLANANNFTFLAPSNDAIKNFVDSTSNNLTGDLLNATVHYSLLQGGFPSLSFTNISQFVQSNLLNSSYANVSAGQAVELLSSSNGEPQVLSGNKSISTIKTAVSMINFAILAHSRY
jgi:hypothetical protein